MSQPKQVDLVKETLWFKGGVCRIEQHLAECTWQKRNIIFSSMFSFVLNPMKIRIVRFCYLRMSPLYLRRELFHGGRHVSTVAQNGQTALERMRLNEF